MKRWIRIENPGEAPVEGFTVLGVSTTRNDGREGLIGQFGSGSKFAINLLMRMGLPPVIFCGRKKLEFEARPQVIDDGLTRTEMSRLWFRAGGRWTASQTVIEHGGRDWQDAWMVLREFWANAMDRSVRQTGDWAKAAMDVVAVEEPKGRSGFTTVWIPADDRLLTVYAEMPKRFLHWSRRELLDKRILPKIDGGAGASPPVIYRDGVFVRQLSGARRASLFDYNLPGHLLRIDESRNADDYAAISGISACWRTAGADDVSLLLLGLQASPDCFEAHRLDTWQLRMSETKNSVQREWLTGWQKAFGSKALACRDAAAAAAAQEQGWIGVTLPTSELFDAFRRLGVPTVLDKIDGADEEGRVPCEPTEAVRREYDRLWAVIVGCGMHRGKTQAELRCFRCPMSAGTLRFGYYREADKTIHVSADVGGHELSATLLEEIAHYVTGARDGARDLQDYAFRLAAVATADRPPSAAAA